MANITNQGVPNVFTEGAIGDIYTDTKTGYKYKCISVITVNTAEGSTPYHTWVRIVENTSSGGSGTDGYSPTVSIEEIDGGHRITVTDVNGDQYFDVLDGEKGDVGLTDEEKEIYDEAVNKAHEHSNKDIIDTVTQEKIDNWDSKATEDYVDTKVANLVGSAPETMNTLEELATAIENNNDVVEVLDQAITNKADKDGTNATGDWSINITGNAATADSATKATQDANGNNITDTYASKEDLTNTSSEKDITGIAEGECPTITDSTDALLLYTKIKGYTLQDGTPTPDAPVDVLGLCNYVDLISGLYAADINGVYVSSTGAVCSSNKIYCKPGDEVVIEYGVNTNSRILFFSSSNDLITSTNVTSESSTVTATAPEDTTYCLFNIGNEGVDISEVKYAVVKINGNYYVTTKTCGKNLLPFDLDDIKSINQNSGTWSENIFSINGLTFTVNDDGSVTVNGTSTKQYIFNLTSKYYNLLNRDLIISGCPIGGTTDTYLISAYNDSVDTNKYVFDYGDGSSSFNFNKFGFIGIVIRSGVTLDNVTFYPMIRLASTEDSTYEPYQETVATIPIDSPLYEGDYIEVYADGSGKIVRESNLFYCKTIKSYDISRDIALLQFEITNSSDTKRVLTKCNSFIQKLAYNFSYEHFYIEGNVINLFIRKDRFPSPVGNLQSEFTSYIQSNPIYFVYYLATPIETPLTAEQVAQFKNLYSFDNITNLSCDGEVSVQYYKNTDNGKIAKIVEDKVSNGDLSSFDFSTLSDDQVSQLKTQLGLS